MCRTCQYLGREKATDTNSETFYCRVYKDELEDIDEIWGCDDYKVPRSEADILEAEENTLDKSEDMAEDKRDKAERLITKFLVDGIADPELPDALALAIHDIRRVREIKKITKE